jgi:hypothetical protein
MSNQDLKNNLLQLLQINNSINQYKNEIDGLKKQKDNLEKNLIFYMEKNDMTNKNIIVNDQKIKYNTTKNYETFSKKYLLNNISTFLKDENVANELVNYLYNNREIKESKSIKITNTK